MTDFARTLQNQRGMAMIMGLIVLLVLSTLIVAFSVMSVTEPTIANNHMRSTEARAIAEAGIEQAIWALNNPSAVGGIPDPANVPSPYNNEDAVPVLATDGTQRGVFRVAVAPGPSGIERTVTSVGWVPTDSSSDPRTKAHRKVRADVRHGKLPFVDPPCAMCVRGALQLTGNTTVDASGADPLCGGGLAKVATMTTGKTTKGGNAKVYADGDVKMLENQDEAAFEGFTLKQDELEALRNMAKAQGTYYQGTKDFNSGNMPNGVVFVDTVDGQDITADTPIANFADVTITGKPGTSTVAYKGQTYGDAFQGWLIVNGSLKMSGNMHLFGMVYATNSITSYAGTGTIIGAVISQNIRDTTSFDSTLSGNSEILYDCGMVKTAGGSVPRTWFARTYRELPGL